MVYTFQNGIVFLSCFLFILIMNSVACITKKASFSLISLVFFVGSLIVHTIQRESFLNDYIFNMIIDMVAIAISITSLLIVDEIETRRAVIKNVFTNKYKSK